MIGWRDGGGNSTGATEALDALCHWTHTHRHTHRLGTQISEQFSGWMIGSLMLILPLQDWLITLAIPFHAAIPTLASLLLWPFLGLLQQAAVFYSSSSPFIPLPPLFLSLWACCVAITMTEAIRDIYHMCGGVSKRKPSTGLGGG